MCALALHARIALELAPRCMQVTVALHHQQTKPTVSRVENGIELHLAQSRVPGANVEASTWSNCSGQFRHHDRKVPRCVVGAFENLVQQRNEPYAIFHAGERFCTLKL
jgi:hypothetical protein